MYYENLSEDDKILLYFINITEDYFTGWNKMEYQIWIEYLEDKIIKK